MSFKRIISPETFSSGDKLTRDLIGIGFRLKGKANSNPNIENSLLASSFEGMAGDLRIVSLLVDWLDIHHPRINVDRLFRILKEVDEARVLAFWSAIGKWKSADRRFSKIAKLYKGKRVPLLSSGTEFHVQRSGEDLRFKDTPLLVPQGAGIRHRPSDILTPHELAKKHLIYYHRLLIGPTYRADMWAELELNPELTATQLAHTCYGSFATAWQVLHEWKVLKEAA